MKELPTVTPEGRCSKCGSSDLMLAEDKIEYSPCEFVGKFQRKFSAMKSPAADDAVRFFCRDCGERHAVPEELT